MLGMCSIFVEKRLHANTAILALFCDQSHNDVRTKYFFAQLHDIVKPLSEALEIYFLRHLMRNLFKMCCLSYFLYYLKQNVVAYAAEVTAEA